VRWLAVFAMALSGCVLPTLEALEREKPRSCDAEHPCAMGYACLENRCVKSSATDCVPGEVRACGSAMGECRPGMQRCVGGTFDSCAGGVSPVPEICDNKDNDCDGMTDEEAATTACERMAGVCQSRLRACVGGVAEAICTTASYGPMYESTETSCDGRDNDCDGQTDEALPAMSCALTRGVCAGTTTTCRNGAYACAPSDYAARDSGYEISESRCDGLDNDCDGLTDVFAALQLSDAGPTARRVAAVARPNGDQLALYEVGARVMTRVLWADGGLSAERFPSYSVEMATQRAELPALAISGAQVMEAWFELLPTMKYRLVIAQANELGEATVGGAAAIALVQPRGATDGGMAVPPGQGQALRLGMTSSRLVVAWANFDETGTTTSVSLASCPLTLDEGCYLVPLGAGRSPSLLIDADVAFVAFETASGIRLTRVAVPSAGAATAGPTADFGSAGAHDPVLSGTAAALSLFSVVAGVPQTLSRATGNCSGACGPSGFTTTPMLTSFVGTPANFSVVPSASSPLLAWDEGLTGARVLKVMRVGAAPVDVGPGRRPIPVLGAAMKSSLFFDTEGAPATVFRRNFCSL